MSLPRPVRRAAALAGLVLLGVAPEVAGQESRDSAKADTLCNAVLAQKDIATQGGCDLLGTSAVEVLSRPHYFGPRDVQSDVKGASTAGSPAQADPVPGAQPTAVGGASVAAVGADSGAKAIVAMTVNPAIFFTSLNDTEAIAEASRIADLTVLFPVDDLDRDEDGRVDYFGTRLRLNFTGKRAGRTLLKEAGENLLKLVQKEAELDAELLKVFRSAPDVGECYEAVTAEETDPAEVASHCGTTVVATLDKRRYSSFREKLAEARAEADAKYLGLDLRFDFGDPTLGAVENARATSFDAGLAWGQRFLGATPGDGSIGLKARLAARYTHLDDIEETSYAVDGAFGLEARRPLEQGQDITVSAGFELRYGGEDAVEEELQTNFTVFRAALAVPLAGMTGLTLGVTAPIDGPISPALTVNFDWGLLLPKR